MSRPDVSPLPSPEAEAGLARRLRAGDGNACGALLDLYWVNLVRYATAILGDRDLAEDVVQEAFVQLWRRRKRWRRGGSLRSLLYRMVRNAALNERRHGDMVRTLARKLAWLGRGRGPTPLQSVEAAETESLVRDAIEALPPRRREIFLLVRHHGMTYEEAADALGLSRQTVANQVSRALADLGDALSPHLNERGGRDLSFPDAEAG